MILFRQIWLLAFSQPFLFLAIPLDLCYAQNLTVRGLKLKGYEHALVIIFVRNRPRESA